MEESLGLCECRQKRMNLTRTAIQISDLEHQRFYRLHTGSRYGRVSLERAEKHPRPVNE